MSIKYEWDLEGHKSLEHLIHFLVYDTNMDDDIPPIHKHIIADDTTKTDKDFTDPAYEGCLLTYTEFFHGLRDTQYGNPGALRMRSRKSGLKNRIETRRNGNRPNQE